MKGGFFMLYNTVNASVKIYDLHALWLFPMLFFIAFSRHSGDYVSKKP
jgi:hypothetical protein